MDAKELEALKQKQKEAIEAEFPSLKYLCSTSFSYLYRGAWNENPSIWKFGHSAEDQISSSTLDQEIRMLWQLKPIEGIITIYAVKEIRNKDYKLMMRAAILEDGGDNLAKLMLHPNLSFEAEQNQTFMEWLAADDEVSSLFQIPGYKLRALKPEAIDTIALQLMHTLEQTHKEGIVHRDIKPENITARLNGGIETRILDLGIATREQPKTLRMEPIMGTFRYMDMGFYFRTLGSKSYDRGACQLDIYALAKTILEMGGLHYEMPANSTWSSEQSTEASEEESYKVIRDYVVENEALTLRLENPVMAKGMGIYLPERKHPIIINALNGEYESISEMRKEWEDSEKTTVQGWEDKPKTEPESPKTA